MKYLSIAQKSINHFSLEKSDYQLFTANHAFEIKDQHKTNNQIFIKDQADQAKFLIDFSKSKDCQLYLGKNISGKIKIVFFGNNSVVYIGDNCKLNQLRIRSKQNQDFIAIGDGVTTSGQNIWTSGGGAEKENPALIIGDDCMFANDIVIRNSDAHPIFDLESDRQINLPRDIVHIEPHVWVGEQVKILKSVTIGACSIVALGSIVTKNIPRFSIAKGIPAQATTKDDLYWARSYTDHARNKAKYYVAKYKSDAAGLRSETEKGA